MLFLVLNFVFAQECKPDVVVDDYKIRNESLLTTEQPPPLRFFNLLGGDYGAKDATIAVNPSPNSNMIIKAGWGPADTSESSTHPGGPVAHNYWYVKFDLNACFDLRGYSGFEMDLLSPLGSDFYITLTQHASDCKTRLIDSVYRNLTDYVKPNGTLQTVFIPFQDFKKNLVGNDFDFQFLKDVTFVNLGPENAEFELKMFRLRGCRSNSTGSVGTVTGTGTSTSTTPVRSSAWIIGSGFFISIFWTLCFMF
jgi:hypothetical protein